MCGIGGIVRVRPGPPPEARELARMAGALRHRGPDELAICRDGPAGLVHARLAIVDLRGGRQPMSTEDGSLRIVFNGEIFDHVEVRRQLVRLGHSFRTRSDTEVLLRAWQTWGEEALERLDGQFAFAVWEARRQRLVMARDRFGIHPLYWAEHDGSVLFASEVKGLFAGAPDMPRALDPFGLEQTFTFWSVVPPQTVFRGVHELEPGHVRAWERGRVTDRSWWTPRFRPVDAPATSREVEESAEAVLSALERRTALRMLRADVPVGCYLSGGLDSSLVAALGRRAVGERFHTFSLRFEDAEFDETFHQRLVSRSLDTQHHEVLVRRGDIARVFPEVVRHTERPIPRTAPAPLFLLSRRVREVGLKVVLTGEGADEVFAGYDLFREGRIRRYWARSPGSRIRPRLLQRLYPYMARSPLGHDALARHFFGRDLARWQDPGFAHGTRWRTGGALLRLLAPEVRTGRDPVAELLADLPADFDRWSFLAQDQYLEMRTLLSGYLLSSQGDRMLMAHSVEGRFPFLAPEVIDLAASLPDDHKLRGLDEKHVLKRAACGLVPDGIVKRSKQPYRAPEALSFVGPRAPAWIEEVLDEAAVRDAGVFSPTAVARLWAKCNRGAERGPLSHADDVALVGVLSTQLLHRDLVRARPAAEPPRDVIQRLPAAPHGLQP